MELKAFLLFFLIVGPFTASGQFQSLSNLDTGLLYQFAKITLIDDLELEAEIVAVINERPFMWTPMERDTIVMFKLGDEIRDLASFTTNPNDLNAIFSLNTDTIKSIEIKASTAPMTYVDYLRSKHVTLHHMPIDGEAWVSTATNSYHNWEDGRSNYAWDLCKLNNFMMSYSNNGQRNEDFTIFGENIYLPIGGTVFSVDSSNTDNEPDLMAAIDYEDLDNGNDATLEETPHNKVEIGLGGPFVFRTLHQKQDSIPSNVVVGASLPVGSFVGQVGNSGTTYVPHLHLGLGFFDQFDRYWSLPIEWEGYKHRNMLAYPTGYEYGSYHNWAYGIPEYNQCISI